MVFEYSVSTAQQVSRALGKCPTLDSAISSAKKYARSCCLSWIYHGHSPTITIRDARGMVVHEEQL
jgi:hypothetical protein